MNFRHERYEKRSTPCLGCGEPIKWLYCNNQCEQAYLATTAKKQPKKKQAKQLKQLTLWSE